MYTGAHSFIHVVLYIFQYSIFIDLLKVGWWEWPFFCLLLSLNLSANWYHLEIFTIRIRIIKKKKDLVFTQFSLFLILCVCVFIILRWAEERDILIIFCFVDIFSFACLVYINESNILLLYLEFLNAKQGN